MADFFEHRENKNRKMKPYACIKIDNTYKEALKELLGKTDAYIDMRFAKLSEWQFNCYEHIRNIVLYRWRTAKQLGIPLPLKTTDIYKLDMYTHKKMNIIYDGSFITTEIIVYKIGFFVATYNIKLKCFSDIENKILILNNEFDDDVIILPGDTISFGKGTITLHVGDAE